MITSFFTYFFSLNDLLLIILFSSKNFFFEKPTRILKNVQQCQLYIISSKVQKDATKVEEDDIHFCSIIRVFCNFFYILNREKDREIERERERKTNKLSQHLFMFSTFFIILKLSIVVIYCIKTLLFRSYGIYFVA